MESSKKNLFMAMTSLAVTLLALTPVSQAALVAAKQAYEMTANQVERWPLGDSGSIVFRPCRNCDPVALQVDAATRYGRSLSGNGITREELLQLKSMLSSIDDTFVYIFYRPDDGVATRIVLDVGE